jgi:hypothetical protein
MPTPLADLDELVLRCRDDRAKSLIAEAVSSYKVGAFRAAIVATWIAVSFDLIEKLRELALAGDSGAEKQVERLERIRAANDIASALAFERELLKLSRDEFELISPVEYVDLERVQADRHRCAHPSLADESSPYAPSAELARTHIVSAVDHVLRHPPAQGKFALARLLSQVDSEYFPTRKTDAIAAFSVGPLKKARESLVRNLVIVLVKSMFVEQGPSRARRRAALAAVQDMYSAIYSDALSKKLSPLIRALPDELLYDALAALSDLQGGWAALELDVQQRFRNFVANLPSAHIGGLEWLLDFTPLADEAKRRTAWVTRKELKSQFFFSPPEVLMDRMVALYASSESFDQANDWAKELMGYKSDFTANQVRELIRTSSENREVTGSFRFSDLLAALRDVEVLPRAEFDAVLQQHGLGEYCDLDNGDIPF